MNYNSDNARRAQRLTRHIQRAKSNARAFVRTAKILELSAENGVEDLDLLSEAIGAERVIRILAQGASHRDLTKMLDFIRVRNHNRSRQARRKAAGAARLRLLERRRAARLNAERQQ